MFTQASTLIAVHHPLDPVEPRFDFWTWRLKRRFVADQLRSLALGDPDRKDTLATAANAFELESVDNGVLKTLADMLEAPLAHQDLDMLAETLNRRMPRSQLSIKKKSPLPILRPDWSAVPVHTPLFAGQANGVPLKARLERSRSVVPPYRVFWIEDERKGDESSGVRVDDPIGKNLTYAKSIWDWLFSRRLTMLCMRGDCTWPDPEASPIALPSEWQVSGRPL